MAITEAPRQFWHLYANLIVRAGGHLRCGLEVASSNLVVRTRSYLTVRTGGFKRAGHSVWWPVSFLKKLQNVMAVTEVLALFWQTNHVEGQNTDYPGDGHEKEVDPWRYRPRACELVRARRCRSHNPCLRFTRCRCLVDDPPNKSEPVLWGLIQKCPSEMEGRAMTSACSSCAVLSPSNCSLIYWHFPLWLTPRRKQRL
jgi:hypothetical protein